MKTCSECGEEESRDLDARGKFKCELRPYGANGAMICFGCAMGTTENKRRTKSQFVAQLDAAGEESILTDLGPVPLDPSASH